MQRDPWPSEGEPASRRALPSVEGFTIVDRVGRGPRGDVFQARTSVGAEVALKIVHPSLAARSGFTTLFEKETAALLSLSHPSILPALSRGRSGGLYYFTSEWMPRGAVRGPLPAPEAARAAQEICEALEYAHRRSTPHRNLVAENVFLDAGGRVKVADFGISLLQSGPLDDAGFVTRPGDARSDLYAAGVVLAELLTGERSARRSVPPPRSTGSLPRIPGCP